MGSDSIDRYRLISLALSSLPPMRDDPHLSVYEEPNMHDHAGQFASDNYSGICPEAWEAMDRANAGDSRAYGEDDWTQRASDGFRELFETDCDVYFVFNGTAANSLALASLCQSYHSVICHQFSHLETDECGAPEFFSNGSKLLLGGGENAKLTAASVAEWAGKRSDIHYPRPKVVSLTQPSEFGTLYKPDEMAAIHQVAKEFGLKIHMDGARFANAVAALELSPAELSWKQGVDVLCFSGTKNGMAVGEAVIFFNRKQSEDFAYRCKQAGQLSSKMRFLSAPWLGMLESGAWLSNARHANQCATYMAKGLMELGIQPASPVEANSVFIDLPPFVEEGLRSRGWLFYSFIGGSSRFVCSWNSRVERIDQLLSDIEALSS